MISNTKDLWTELSNTIEMTKRDRSFLKQAAEINNSAGKMINVLRIEMEHARLVASQPKFERLKLLNAK